MGVLAYFETDLTWTELGKRTFNELLADDCLDLAAELAYYFFLALFPALLFLVALASFFPVGNLMDTIVGSLSRVAPPDVLSIVRTQVQKIGSSQNGGLLTLGMVLTIWSTSAGVMSIISTLNRAYDIDEGRPWWKVRLLAIGLTFALGIFVVVSFALVLVGPAAAQHLADRFGLGPAFVWIWWIAQWPLVFAFVSFAIALVFYFAPDAEQDFVYLTPGSVLATLLWLLFSLGFKVYVANFANYNETYGTIGGVIVLLLWFYTSALAMLIGAEMNAEIEHASAHGKAPGEKVPGVKRKIGMAAAREWARRRISGQGTTQPAAPSPAAPRPAAADFDKSAKPASVAAGGLIAAVLTVLRRRRTRE
jgi:membrane protein